MYTVVVDEYYNQEFGFWLYVGDVLADGDIEPDLAAELVSRGVLVPDGVDALDEPEPDDED